MGSVRREEIPNEAAAMQMIWKMIKDFYVPEREHSYWEAFQKRCLQIDAACQSRLAQKMMNAVGDYLEEKLGGQ